MNFAELRKRIQTIFGESDVYQYPLVWTAVFAGIAILGLAVFLPLSAQLRNLEGKIKDLKVALEGMGHIELRGEERLRLMDRIEEDFREEARQFVSAAEISLVIKEISKQAQEREVAIKTVSYKAAEGEADGPNRLVITVEATGPYPQVADWIGGMKEHLVPFFTWEGVELGALDKKTGSVQARLEMAFYSPRGSNDG